MSKKTKTIEELLEEALVPEEEQPYEVPGNWVWVKFDSVIKVSSNGAIPIKQKEYQKKGFIPVIDQGMQLISGFTSNQENIYTGELPVIVFGDHTKCIKWVDFKFAQGADGTKLLKPETKLYPKYFYHLLCVVNLPDKGYSRHFKYLRESVLPLPPLNEQKRIAEKVEHLLNKIEEAKQLIEEAKETFELRRAAILDKAFRGELTEKWRKTIVNIESAETLYRKIKDTQTGKRKRTKDINNIELRYDLPSTWKWVRIGDIFSITSGGTPKRNVSAYYEGEIPWVKTGEIKWNYIYDSEEKITTEAITNSSAKLLPIDTVLVAMYGQGLTRGRASILSIEASCNQAVCALLPNQHILPKFLFYYFMEGYQRFRNVAKGGNQENLSASVISDFLFPLPPLEEQIEIARIVDKVIEKEEKVMANCDLVESIEELKHSILSKAFRGELGTNDPSDEHAIELLREVLQEQVK